VSDTESNGKSSGKQKRNRGRERGSRRSQAESRLAWIADAVLEVVGGDLVWLGKEGWYWRNNVTRVWSAYADAAVMKRAKGVLASTADVYDLQSAGKRPTGRDIGDCMALVRVEATPPGLLKRSKKRLLPGPWHLHTGQDCQEVTYWRNYATQLVSDDWPEFWVHNDSVFMTRSLPWDYQRSPEPTPLWDKFLCEAVPDAETRFFVEAMVGRTLARDVDYHYLPVVYGPAGTGKTTFMQVLSRLVGLESVAEVNSASDLGGRFAGEIFVSAQMIVMEELDRTDRKPDAAERLGRARIKAITGGQAPSAEIKYSSGRSVVDKPPTIWLCGNYLPLWVQGAKDVEAWKRRLAIIPFVCPVPRGSQIAGLGKRIAESEGAAIASRCYHQWSVWVRGEARMPELCRDMLGELITQSLPLAKRWAVECLEIAPGCETSADDIHACAGAWYEARDADYDRLRQGQRVLAQVRAAGAKPYRTKAGMVYVGVAVRGEKRESLSF